MREKGVGGEVKRSEGPGYKHSSLHREADLNRGLAPGADVPSTVS